MRNSKIPGNSFARKAAAACRSFFSDREHVYLLAILVFGIALSVVLFKGPSFYGDDTSYLQYVPSILNGTFAETINIFSIRLLMDLPLAASVGLFGYTDLGAGFWALLSYAATIILVYMIGRELYDGRAGLIAAFLFSIYPLSLHYNTSPDPMLPMVLFASASLLAFIYGRKRRSIGMFTLSGIFAYMGTLANPLAYLYLVFYAFFMAGSAIYDSVRKRRLSFYFGYLAVFGGLLIALTVIGYVNMALAPSGNPFFELSLTNSYYSAAGGPDQIYYTNPSLTFYLSGYFPYDFTNNVLLRLLSLNLQGAAAGIGGVVSQMFSSNGVNLNDVGLFGYAVVLAGIYLVARRDRRAYFALLLASFLVLYMEFGSMSITHYFPIYKLMRFTATVAVPLMLVLGIACSSFLKSGSRGRGHELRYMAVAAVISLLLVTSIYIDYYYYALNHNSMLYIKQMASAIEGSGTQHANVLAPAQIPYFLSYYMGYGQGLAFNQYDNGAYGGLFLPTCDSIPNNTYLIIPSDAALNAINAIGLWNVNETWAFNPSLCNLRLYSDVYNATALRGISPYDPTYTGNVYYKP